MSDGDGVTEAFNDLMGEVDHAMVIVTTASGGVRAGCLVGFHAQAGIDPPGYAVWLSKANHTYRVGALADVFAVHFPSAASHALAELFGGTTGDEVDKFERCRWTPGPGGVPLLDDCPNRFVGRRAAWLDAGTDHVCLVLRPEEAEVDEAALRPGVLWFGGIADVHAAHEAEERQRPVPGPHDG